MYISLPTYVRTYVSIYLSMYVYIYVSLSLSLNNHTEGGSFIEKGAVSVSIIKGVLSPERAAAMSSR